MGRSGRELTDRGVGRGVADSISFDLALECVRREVRAIAREPRVGTPRPLQIPPEYKLTLKRTSSP